MKNIFIALAACGVACGCATSQQQINSHAPALDSWLGAPIEDFLGVQGVPTAVIEGSQRQIYEFEHRKPKRFAKWGKSCNPRSNPVEPQQCVDVITHTHVTTFTCTYALVVVDSVIDAWSMNGNNCRMVTVQRRPG